MLFHRRTRHSDAGREALAGLVAAPTFELIPLRTAIDEARRLPTGARVSVTASPGRGLEATLSLCEGLAGLGLRPVPHLAARTVRDRRHLRELLARADDAGVERVFVVGGDAKEPGAYPDALALLREMAELGLRFRDVGIAGYPQGHPFIADSALLAALRDKTPYATYLTTQLCFDPEAIGAWLAARRSEGFGLPVHIGVPGVAEPHRLLAIAARIGVADTSRFLAKNTRFVARLLRSGGFYRPDALLDGIADLAADPGQGIAGLHVYTFNAVRATEAWRRGLLARLGGRAAVAPAD